MNIASPKMAWLDTLPDPAQILYFQITPTPSAQISSRSFVEQAVYYLQKQNGTYDSTTLLFGNTFPLQSKSVALVIFAPSPSHSTQTANPPGTMKKLAPCLFHAHQCVRSSIVLPSTASMRPDIASQTHSTKINSGPGL